MSSQFKYGLKNARALLDKFKHGQVETEQQQQENTFVEESSIEQEEQNILASGNTLANFVILEHLQSTLDLYKNDLQVLADNRDNLMECIQLLIEKIRNLTELQSKNREIKQENEELSRDLRLRIQQYHRRCLENQTIKMKLNSEMNTTKNKVKAILQCLHADSYYDGYMDQWTKYLQEQSNLSLPKYSQQPILRSILGQQPPNVEQQKTNQTENNRHKKQTQKEDPTKTNLVSNLKEFSRNFKVPK